MTPNAKPNDAQFDVLMMHKMNLWQRIFGFAKTYSGEHIHLPYFSIQQSVNIEVSGKRKMPMAVDGEFLDSSPCRIAMLPGAMKVKTL